MGKSDRVIETAAAAEPPWEHELIAEDGRESLALTRGDESMQIDWDRGGLVHPLTYSLSGVKEVKLRNVAAALKVIVGKPDYTKRAPATRRERSAPAAPTAIPLPFDIVEATDQEIIKAVRGKKLVWLNEMAGEYESAQVPDRFPVQVPDGNGGKKTVWRTSPNITLKTTTAGRRVLTFPAVGEQYRSVGLDRLVQVR